MSKKMDLVEIEMMEVLRGPVENIDHIEEVR